MSEWAGKWVLVGTPPSRGNNIRQPVEKRCEKCRTRTYLSRSTLQEARRKAAAAGRTPLILCWACAKPIMREIAVNGGTVEGSETVIREDLIPVMDQFAEDELRSN